MMKKNKRMTGLFALLLAALLLTPVAKAQTVNPKPFTVPEIKIGRASCRERV